MKVKPTLALLFLTFLSIATFAQNFGDYRTIASGSYSSAAIWEYYDGFGWTTTSSAPNTLANEIRIRAPHVVTMNGITVNQLIVDSGATVNQTFDVLLSNALGDEIIINGTWNSSGGMLGATTGNAGTVVVNGLLNWAGGVLANNNGFVLTINPGGTMNLNNLISHELHGCILENNGTVNWNSGTLYIAHGSDTGRVINNGAFNVLVAGSGISGTSLSKFVNGPTGTFTKNSTGTLTISGSTFIFLNYGQLQVNNGTFALSNATVNNHGTIEANSPGAYNCTSTSMYAGSKIKGNGFVAMGYLYIGGAASVDTLATVTHNSGYLYGPGVLTIHGTYTMNAGEMGTPNYIFNGLSQVQTSAVGTLNFNGSTAKTITRTQITNHGTTNWNGGDMSLNTISPDTTKFINSGIFNLGAGTLNLFGQAPARFINTASGTVNKSTTGTFTTQQGTYFENRGLINITDGIFSTNNQNASFHNYGTIQASGTGTFNGQWNVNLYAGSLLTGNGTFTANGSWVVHGATVVDTISTISQTGGVLIGPGSFTVHGTYNMSAGEIGGPTYISGAFTEMTISPVGTLNLNSGAQKLLSRSRVINYGTTNLNAGDLHINSLGIVDTAKYVNNGIFNIGAGATNLFSQNGARFINTSAGTVNKSTTGTFTIMQSSIFQNYGLINITDGIFSTNNQNSSFHNHDTIICTGTGTFNGQWNVNHYAGSFLTGNGNFIASGNWVVHGATVVDTVTTISHTGGYLIGPGSFTMHGTYNMSAGEIGGPTYINGSFTEMTISPVGTLNLNSGAQKILSRARVINYGTTNLNAGDLHINSSGIVDTAKFVNHGTFNIGAGATNLFSQGGARFINTTTGTVNKSTTGTFTIMQSSIYQNYGLINISNGTFSTNNQNAAFHSFSEVHVASPGTFDGRWNVNLHNGAHFSGNGNVNFQGNVVLVGSAAIDSGCTANLLGGQIAGTGPLTIQGTLNWTDGDIGNFWSPYTNMVVDTFGSITLNGTLAKELSKTKLINYGTIDWNDGTWDFTTTVVPDTCMLINYGTVNLNTTSSFWNGQSNTHIRNMSTGLIYKPTSTFLTLQTGLTCRNQGTIQGTGTLVMNATFQSEGTISPGLSPGTLALNGQQPFASGSNLFIELNDASGPGTGHDLLTRNSNITLDGMLSVLETGFVPNGTYTIIQLSAGTVGGSFDTLNIPWYYTVGTTTNTVFLTKNFYFTVPIQATICFGETFDFNGQLLAAAGAYIDTLSSVLGFDSIIQLQLNVETEIVGSFLESACDSYVWNGQTYNASGPYQQVFTAANGCDSTATLNLTIYQNSSTVISAIVCDSYTNPSGTLTWTSSGTYTETLTNAVFCDSVVTYNITINESTSGSTQVTACNSYRSPSGNYLWTQSGVFVDTITNNVWCDSVLTIDLTIENTNTAVSSDCAGLTAELSGAGYQWVNCSNYSPINGATGQSFSPSAAGDYAVIITDGACIDTSACIAFESSASGDPLQTVSLYPNPASGAFFLTFPCPVEDMTVTIFNTAAQVMSRRKYELTSVIRTELILQSGTYIIQLTDRDGRIEYLRLVIL